MNVLRIALGLAISLPAFAAEDVVVIDTSVGSVTFDVLNYAEQRFDMGVVTDDWSEGRRYELNILRQLSSVGRVKPAGGGYFFYEEHDWQGAARANADYNCWGFGFQAGGSIQLGPPEPRLGISLVPHVRGGIGFQDLEVHDLPISSGGSVNTYNMSAGTGRVEVAAGLDLRLVMARRFEVVFGFGADYWSSSNVYVTAGTSGAGLAVVGNSYSFHGNDSYVRFGIGVHL